MNIHARCQASVMDSHTLMLWATSKDRHRSCTFRLSGSNSKSRSITRASRSVSTMLKPNPFLSRGRVEAFQNARSAWLPRRAGDHCSAYPEEDIAVQEARQRAPVGISRDPDTDSRVKRLHPGATESYGRTVQTSQASC